MDDNVDEEGVPEAVVAELLSSIQAEVEAALQGPFPPSVNGFRRCPFCPFRAFQRPDRLRKHMQTYHTRDRMFTANSRTDAQWRIALALFEQQQAWLFMMML